MADPAPKKIAVLGGGVGAMTAVFELTEDPDWQKKWDITVYQLGWRTGGKGASGRNRDEGMGDRIEEHGLHLWFGYYENAFNVIQRAYSALGRMPGQPLATWQEAFKPHSLFILMQYHRAQWSEWPLMPPTNHQVPGDGQVPTFWDAVDRLLELVHIHYRNEATDPLRQHVADQGEQHGFFAGLMQKLEHWGAELAGDAVVAVADEVAGISAARATVQKLKAHPDDDALHALLHDAVAALEGFLDLVRKALHGIEGFIDGIAEDYPRLARLLSLLELGVAMFRGIVVDDVARKGFDQLDHLDLREWLHSHGAGPLAVNSDTLRVAYESIFAFQHGSYELPNLAAGTGLRGLMRLTFTYKGAFAWKMQAGMGDTIFAPFYLALKQRGVKFKFFHAVRDIVPADDGSHIARINIGVQATTKPDKDGNRPEYNPLYDVKGLLCWPNKPLFEQLEQGQQLQFPYVNLESWWTDWQDVESETLEVGRDFDLVINGISLGAIPHVASKLMAQKPAWAEMVAHVEAISTQAFQMWMIPDAARLRTPTGDPPENPDPQAPVFGGFAQPHNTVADMTHLLERENWPEDNRPKSLYYFCGPKSHGLFPMRGEHGFPKAQADAANVRAAEWLRSNGQFILPGTLFAGYPESFPDTFNFNKLYTTGGPIVPASGRFNHQYWRANNDPSELYVLSLKGTTQKRIKATDTGYANLYCAGDWTFTGLNYGCVEAATMSGMEVSRALSGHPKIIFGENFPKP